jgi:hypothetical protein
VKELLGIPDAYVLGATLVLGQPVREITRLRRVPVEEFATFDRFDGPAVGAP